MLKVAQANHAAFAFLDSDHPLHSYFTHLRHTRQQQQQPGAQHESATAGTTPAQTAVLTPAEGSAASVMAAGPPPGIRRKPALDTAAQPVGESSSDTANQHVEQPFPALEQAKQQQVERTGGAREVRQRAREAVQADDVVAQQLQAAKQRLLALIAQRATGIT